MKLKTKLYLGFGAILILMILSLGFVINTANEMSQSLNEIVRERYEMVRLANIVQNETNNTARMLRDGILDRSQDITLKEIEDIRTSRTKATQAIEKLEGLISSEEIRELVTGLKTVNKSYNNASEEVISLVQVQQWEKATTVLIYDYKQVRLHLLDFSSELQTTQEKAMENILKESTTTYEQSITTLITFMAIIFTVGATAILWLLNTITDSINRVTSVISSVDYENTDKLPRIEVHSKDEIGEIAIAFNEMALSLEENVFKQKDLSQKMQEQSWLDNKIAEIAVMSQGVQDLKSYAEVLISQLINIVGANYGVFYIKEGQGEHQTLRKLASYAWNNERLEIKSFKLGEGLVGQCALEKKVINLKNVPDNPVKIILPIKFEGQVVAVIEIASFKDFTPLQDKFLRRALENIGITLNSIVGRMEVEKLLQETQTLYAQLEDLYKNSEQKTKELEMTKVALEEKANQLLLASRYKSEFLANMSHELRTPLNSLLILAQILSENKEGKLSAKQVEYASTIYSSGRYLLNLINDILDLSKIEAGKMEVTPLDVELAKITDVLNRQFKPIAKTKKLDFYIEIEKELPCEIYTDENRLQQILTNLLANAFKFTEIGSVKLSIRKEGNFLAFSVSDTGIGISEEKQESIFEAFQQADGTTSRKYGGTGLGLSISRKLADLLNGSLEVSSIEGIGSTFTLLLPMVSSRKEETDPFIEIGTPKGKVEEKPFREVETTFKDKKILIIDDDMRNIFALTAALEELDAEVIFAENGKKGLDLLDREAEIDLILMDIMMPEMDGYQAMEEIRKNPKFVELPIIAVTAKAMGNDRENCLAAGASDYISKPIDMDELLLMMKKWL